MGCDLVVIDMLKCQESVQIVNVTCTEHEKPDLMTQQGDTRYFPTTTCDYTITIPTIMYC